MSDKFDPDRGQTRKAPALPLTRLGGNAKPAHAAIYLLADHLDAVLAACEDIVTAHLTWNSGRRATDTELNADSIEIRDAIEHIRKLENLVIMRVLKSRERADEVARVDKRFRQLAKLYTAGTAVLIDAVAECGDSAKIDFATADTVTAYMRSRGLVDPEAPAPAIGENLEVGEDFLIAKRIAAGPLMDLAATLLDTLELHYDLFLDDNELALPPQVNRFEDEPTSQSADAEDGDPLAEAISQIREDAAVDHPDDNPEIWKRLGGAALGATSEAQESADTPSGEDTEGEDPWAREFGLDPADTPQDDIKSAEATPLTEDDEPETSAADGQDEVLANAEAEPKLQDVREEASDGGDDTQTEDETQSALSSDDAAEDESPTKATADAPEPETDNDVTEDRNRDDAKPTQDDQSNIFEADTEIVMLSSRRIAKNAEAESDSTADIAKDTSADTDADNIDPVVDDAAIAADDQSEDPADVDAVADDTKNDEPLIITAANDDEDAEATQDATASESVDEADADEAQPDEASEGEAEHAAAADDSASADEQPDEVAKPAPKSLLSRLRGLKK